jgi:protein-tyrosine-phosphatase/predicted ATP-grasp superfamily ATP-dependent carboligase
MKNRLGRVLVLGQDTRAFLSVVRSLGRFGIEVHAAWCPASSAAAHSRYLYRVHWLPDYSFGDSAWLDSIEELMRREAFDLVIPCHDAAVLLLQSNRRRLETAGRLYLLDDRAFEISFSKEKTYSLAEKLDVCVPEQRTVSTKQELVELSKEWGFPLVLKPQASACLQNPFARHSVRKIWDVEELGSWGSIDAEAALTVQRNFLGKGAGVEVLCREGDILTAFQHERIHEPLIGGGSSYRKSVSLDPRLLAATERLMDALKYTGVAMVEFKVDAPNGKWVLIEINGRFWGSLPLAIAAGLDFPRYLYEMLCLGRTEFPRVYKTDLYCRNWALDLYWLRANLRADRSNPALMRVPPRQVVAEIGNVLTLRERSDTFVLDDPWPAYYDLLPLVASKVTRVVRKVPGVRQTMRRKAVRALLGARNVLFVCKGNICRSPFAERILQQNRPDLTCVSAGFYPVSSRRTPEAAIEAASRFGVDLDFHRSQVLTAELAQRASVIFIFDDEQREAFFGTYPEHLIKVHYLGSLDPAGPLEIPDPYGGQLATFVETYARIQRLLESAPKLDSESLKL